MDLVFSVAALIYAEKALGKPIAAIVDELRSAEGASLTTLAEMVRVGALPDHGWYDNKNLFYVSIDGAAMIEEYGIAKCAAAVGEALGLFLAELNEVA
jgi:hypothetical protein